MTPDIHQRIRDAIAEAIREIAASLNLPDEHVYSLEQVDHNRIDKPAIVVSYEAGSEEMLGGSNVCDHIGYPVLVALYNNGPVNTPEDGSGPSITQFRDTVRALFNTKRLPAVGAVYNCRIVPQPMINVLLPQYEQLQTAIGVVAEAEVERANTWSA